MKKIIIFFLYAITSCRVYAQKDIRDGHHIFNYDIQLKQCKFDGSLKENVSSERIEANTVFVIRNIADDGAYVIQLSKFTSKKENNESFTKTLNERLVMSPDGNDIFFKLSASNYTHSAERLEKKGSFTVGAATSLIKIRPGRKEPRNGYNIYSEFGNDFNIGVSAGWKFKPYRRLELSHSFVGGLSFSSIKVTSYTTQNFLQSESTQGCITFSAGYVFEYNKFQVSGFLGLDIMSGEVGRKWIYRNRPWIGLGFGFQIFRAQGETDNNTKTNAKSYLIKEQIKSEKLHNNQ